MFTKNNIGMNEMNKKSGNNAQSAPYMAGDSNFALYGVQLLFSHRRNGDD